MSEAKFTPGPWEADKWRVARLWQVQSSLGPVECCKVICDTGSNKAIRTEENAANARLIAASPIGYELASEILRACGPGTGRQISDVTRQEIEPLRKLAEKFMAVATGK